MQRVVFAISKRTNRYFTLFRKKSFINSIESKTYKFLEKLLTVKYIFNSEKMFAFTESARIIVQTKGGSNEGSLSWVALQSLFFSLLSVSTPRTKRKDISRISLSIIYYAKNNIRSLQNFISQNCIPQTHAAWIYIFMTSSSVCRIYLYIIYTRIDILPEDSALAECA